MARGSAQDFGAALRQIRDEFKLMQKAIHEQTAIPQPMLSGYVNGRNLPHQRTLKSLIEGLRNLRVPEDRLDNLKAIWEGKDTAPSPADATPPAPAPVASVPEATATPRPSTTGPRVRIDDAEGGGWIVTAFVPATYPEERLGEVTASIRAVLARLIGS